MPEMTSINDGNNADNEIIKKPFITECFSSTDDDSSEEQDDDVRPSYPVFTPDLERPPSSRLNNKIDLNFEDDRDSETDLEIEDEKKVYDLSGSMIYLDTCQDLSVTPVSYFIRHMKDERLTMRHHGLGPAGAKALSVPLQANTSVTSLDLSDNGLEGEGAKHLAAMMKENCYIAYLTISDNQIGSDGATALCDMLSYNTSLHFINLSGNSFTDKDTEKFAQALMENNTLKGLNLSHNNFGESVDPSFGNAIGENETLEMIDLSWNHFRGKSAVNLLEGLTVNTRLKRVYLSWNGLSDEGAMAVGEYLKQNHIVVELDISNNRITTEGATYIAHALEDNESLQVFKIGQNPIDVVGALFLLNSINNDRNALKELDLTDICVDLEFDKIHKEMIKHRQIVIRHGGVLGSFGMSQDKPELDPNERRALRALEDFLNNDPMAILQMHVESKNLRLLDLFRDLDKNNDYRIGVEDVKRKVKAVGLDITDDKIDKLIASIDKDNDGLVDYSSLTEGKTETVLKQRRLSKAVLETFEASGRTSLPADVVPTSVLKFLKTRAPKTMDELLSKPAIEETEENGPTG